jgi:hypothetical protein
MNKTFLLVLGFLALIASLAMRILGNKSSHLSELQEYWWIPLPLALICFLGANSNRKSGQ